MTVCDSSIKYVTINLKALGISTCQEEISSQTKDAFSVLMSTHGSVGKKKSDHLHFTQVYIAFFYL